MNFPLHTKPSFRQARHCIDDVVVELEFSNTLLERRERASIADWLSGELLPALDELFSFYAPGEQTLYFEQLVFDFGRLPASDYRYIIREQLVQKLTRLIKDKSLPLEFNNQQPLLVNRITEPASALKILLDYLRTGQLNVQATMLGSNAGGTPKLHQQLLESLIAEQHIATQLRALPNRSQLIERLLKQFSERHRTALLRQLAPGQLEIALALLDILQTSSVATPTEKIQPVWGYILDIALELPTVSARAWFKELMQRWLGHERESGINFIQHLQQLQYRPDSTAAIENTLTEHWQQLQNFAHGILQDKNYSLLEDVQSAADTEQKEKITNAVDDNHQSQAPNTQQILAGILVRGDATALMHYWPQWLPHSRQLLIAGLKHYLIKPELRQQLLLKLPHAFIADMLVVLVPDLYPITRSFEQHANKYLELLQRLSGSAQFNSTVPDTNQSTAVWLGNIYEILATQIFSIINDDTGNTIHIPSLEKLWNEWIFQIASRYEVVASDLQSMWNGLFQAENTGKAITQDANAVTTLPDANEPLFISADASQSLPAELFLKDAQQAFTQKNIYELERLWPKITGFNSQRKDSQLITAIATQWAQTDIRRILLAELPLSMLIQLLEMIAPAYQHWFSRLAGRRVDLLQQTRHANNPDSVSAQLPVTADNWLREALTLVSDILWNAESSPVVNEPVFTADTLLQKLAQHFAKKYQLAAEPLFYYWNDTIDSLSITPSSPEEKSSAVAKDAIDADIASAVRVALTNDGNFSRSSSIELKKENRKTFSPLVPENPARYLETPVGSAQHNESPTDPMPVEPLLNKIQQALLHKNAHALEQLWPQVSDINRTQRNSLLAAAMVEYWVQADIRQRLLADLSLPVLIQLLELIAPAYQDWFSRLAERRVEFLQEARSLGIVNKDGIEVEATQLTMTTDEWLRDAFAIVSDVLWQPASVQVLIEPTIAKDKLLQQLSKNFAEKYQIAVEPLYYLWNTIF
ncbi:contractile injection system tape measure protein, partial [Cellvibrio mixtus]|uniref:contractile injection system tape measure protein n=1 Tax=Cellvibrio mixtus TaxID=39650 RepID=UPI0005870F36